MLDDVSAITESDYGNDLLSSFNPKYAQVYPSSIRSNITLNTKGAASADTIPENDLNRQVLFNEEKENDEMPFLNLQELKNTQPQQSFTEETPSKFYESPDIFNQEEEGPPIEESSQETTVIPNLLESFNRKEHMERINARHKEKFEEKKGKNPETYARKAREEELKREIKQLKPEIARLNQISSDKMKSGDVHNLKELQNNLARKQAELKYNSIEDAIQDVNNLLDENNLGKSTDDNKYITKADLIRLNKLRALNGERHHAKIITYGKAKKEINKLIPVLRRLQPSQRKEISENRQFGAKISTIEDIKTFASPGGGSADEKGDIRIRDKTRKGKK
jgi:hypothetical protein